MTETAEKLKIEFSRLSMQKRGELAYILREVSVKPLIIHSEARAELDSAIAYYEERKVGFGLDFLPEVEQ